MATYEYNPLSEADNPEIGLLVVHPRQLDDEIHVSLKHSRVSDLTMQRGDRPADLGIQYCPAQWVKRARPLILHDPSRSESYLDNHEALSYVWGSLEKTGIVHVRDSDESERQGIISTTANLDAALRAVRLQDKRRVL